MDSKEKALFEQEIMPHLGMLHGVARKLTGSVSDSEDLVQDSLLKAVRCFDMYEKSSNMRAWLCSIMMNTFINDFHRRKRFAAFIERIKKEEANATDAEAQKNVYDCEHAYQALCFKHFSDEVADAFESINEDFKQVIYMADLQNLSYGEISTSLNIPIGTVMSRLYRARQCLKTKLTSYASKYGYCKNSHLNKEAV